jgi:hypothetical protein
MGALTHRRYRRMNAIMLDNSAGAEFMSTPDPMDTLSSGAFVVELDFIMSDYTPAADRIIVQHGEIEGNLGWDIVLLTTGQFRLAYYELGTAASIASATYTPPFTLTNFRRYGIRASFLSNFVGAVSVYLLDIREGIRWHYLQSQSGALVSPVFDCTGPLNVGVGTGIESIYDFRIWIGKFGIGQIGYGGGERPAITSDIPLQSVDTTQWTSKTGHLWTLDGANFERSEAPLHPYIAA